MKKELQVLFARTGGVCLCGLLPRRTWRGALLRSSNPAISSTHVRSSDALAKNLDRVTGAKVLYQAQPKIVSPFGSSELHIPILARGGCRRAAFAAASVRVCHDSA